MSDSSSASGSRPGLSDSSSAVVTDPVVAGYARAIITVADAEDALDRVEDELFRFARAIETSPDLRDRLVDPSIETSVKLGVVSDLLGGRAHPQTVSAIGYVVQSGRARQLASIADAVVALAAEARQHTFAEVRSAVALDDGQRRRLADALSRNLGRDVDLKVVVDPDVVGGLVVKVGDTVIDGTVARHLSRFRSQMSGAQ